MTSAPLQQITNIDIYIILIAAIQILAVGFLALLVYFVKEMRLDVRSVQRAVVDVQLDLANNFLKMQTFESFREHTGERLKVLEELATKVAVLETRVGK